MRIKYIGAKPYMLNGIWTHSGDVRWVGERQARELTAKQSELFVLIDVPVTVTPAPVYVTPAPTPLSPSTETSPQIEEHDLGGEDKVVKVKKVRKAKKK